MLELLGILWQSVPAERAAAQAAAAAQGASGGGGGAGMLARGLRAGLDEMKAVMGWRAQALLRAMLVLALLVAIVVMLTRPRRRAEFADLMVWMGGQRWDRSELGAAGMHLDRWPLATRRGEERARWRQLRPPPRRVRSEGALCTAAILTSLTRTPRLRSCRTI